MESDIQPEEQKSRFRKIISNPFAKAAVVLVVATVVGVKLGSTKTDPTTTEVE